MLSKFLQLLYDQELSLPDHPDLYKEVLEDSAFPSVAPQINHLLKKDMRLEQTPSFFQAALARESERASAHACALKKQMEALLKQFEHLGVDVMPIKNARFAEKYFGSSSARGMAAAVIHVQPLPIGEVISCLQSLGMAPSFAPLSGHVETASGSEQTILADHSFTQGIDIHWHMIFQEQPVNPSIFWEHACLVPPYRHVKELSDLHTLYMACLDGWKNAYAWADIIDIIQLIHVLNDAIDYEVLFQLAAGQGTEFRVYHTLSAVYHQFPHLEKLLPLPKSGTEWSMAYLEETIDETFPLVTKYHRLAAAEI